MASTAGLELSLSSPAPGRLQGFLQSHPVVLLLLLTPGIPEYLTGSSPIASLVLNPQFFLIQLVANLGLYGPGVLLIYEAKVRWKKGWTSVLLLGAAYGILEEGVALSTLFNPNAQPVGNLGVYGHWLGVNWLWAGGIVPFHALFSISLPIMLLGLALPETAGRSLLSTRRVAVAFAVLAADVVFLMVFVLNANRYWMGLPILLSSLVLIAALVFAAYRLPAGALAPRAGPPSASNRSFFAVGVSFFLAVALGQQVGAGSGLPAAADFILVLLVLVAYFGYVGPRVGTEENRRALLSFAFGLITPLMALGLISQLGLPLVLAADVMIAIFFRRLWSAGPSAQA